MEINSYHECEEARNLALLANVSRELGCNERCSRKKLVRQAVEVRRAGRMEAIGRERRFHK